MRTPSTSSPPRVSAALAVLLLLALAMVFFGSWWSRFAGLAGEIEVLASTADEGHENWRGYVADGLCAECHADIAESFETLGMARSFSSPENARLIEDFSAAGVRDGRLTYRLTREGDEVVFSQWQTAPDGEPIHLWKRRVDWVLGSGSTSRVYLVQSQEGALFELPIAWYTQESSWGTKPGGERDGDEAGLRLVHRGCMYCHNAVPTDPSFQDQRFAPPNFPAHLPEGIGCQRCHGPGLAHVEKAQEAKDLAEGAREGTALTSEQRRALRDAVRKTVVNPENLSSELRRDVCAQCHHQPTVSVFGQRQLDKGDYEFAPGQQLREFLLKLEVVERDREGNLHPPEARFEINHHGYRLERSPCFIESAVGELQCTSCHDAHRKPSKQETLDRTRSKCLQCHTDESKVDTPPMVAEQSRAEHLARTECVSCHMPRRRTQDVVHVVMTDHRIQARPAPEAERLAALPDRTTHPVEVTPLNGEDRGSVLSELALASGSIRMGFLDPASRLPQSLSQAASTLPGVSLTDLTEPRLRLAQAHLLQGRLDQTRGILEELLATPSELEFSEGQQARIWLSMVAARQNSPAEALRLVNEAMTALATEGSEGQGSSGWLHNQRGRLRLWTGQQAGACEDFELAVALNEFLSGAWLQVGRCRIGSGDFPGAAVALERALSLDPEATAAAAPLAAVLKTLGRETEANRVIAHHELG